MSPSFCTLFPYVVILHGVSVVNAALCISLCLNCNGPCRTPCIFALTRVTWFSSHMLLSALFTQSHDLRSTLYQLDQQQPLHFTSFYFITLHFTSFYFIILHFTSFYFILLHFTLFYFIVLHYTLILLMGWDSSIIINSYCWSNI